MTEQTDTQFIVAWNKTAHAALEGVKGKDAGTAKASDVHFMPVPRETVIRMMTLAGMNEGAAYYRNLLFPLIPCDIETFIGVIANAAHRVSQSKKAAAVGPAGNA